MKFPGLRKFELRTERLVLRRWREADREPFAPLNADPLVMGHFPGFLSREDADLFADRIESGFDANGFGLWAVEVPGEAEFIGFVGLSVPSFAEHFMPAVEIGWRLNHGFERAGLEEVVSFTLPANVRSVSVMERLGMTRDPADGFRSSSLSRRSPPPAPRALPDAEVGIQATKPA